MSEDKLFAGSRLRRLRSQQGETQAEMARRLGVSTSYLTLMENEQRPVSAKVLLRLATEYDFDARQFSEGLLPSSRAELLSLARDPRLADLGLGDTDLRHLASRQPEIAVALLRLATADTRSVDAVVAGPARATVPLDPVLIADEHFRRVSQPAEFGEDALLRLSGLFRDGAEQSLERLQQHLQKLFDVTLIRLPAAMLGRVLYRYDHHSRRIIVSELISEGGCRLVALRQVVYLAASDWLGRIVSKSGVEEKAAAKLLRRHCATAMAVMLSLRSFEDTLSAPEARMDALTALSAMCGLPLHCVALHAALRHRQRNSGSDFQVVLTSAEGVVQRADGHGPVTLERGDILPLQSAMSTSGTAHVLDARKQVWQVTRQVLFEPHRARMSARQLTVLERMPAMTGTSARGFGQFDALRARAHQLFPPGYDQQWRFEENSLCHTDATIGLA